MDSIPQSLNIVKRFTVVVMNILGILVSRNFSFDRHITSLLKRCNQTLYLLLKLKRMAYNKHELTNIYTALVTSAINYGVEAYGSSGVTIMRRIDSIQRKAVRWGLTESFVPISEHLASKDKKLLDTLSRRQDHPLSSFLPSRSDYASRHLRSRPPTCANGPYPNFSIFPNRIFKVY